MRYRGIEWPSRLTCTSTVKHEVPCATIAQAPEDSSTAEGGDCGVEVRQLREAVHEYGIVARSGPEPAVRLRVGRLPQRERVGDPVGEEEAYSLQAWARTRCAAGGNAGPMEFRKRSASCGGGAGA